MKPRPVAKTPTGAGNKHPQKQNIAMKIAHISDLHFGRDIPEVANALSRQLACIKPDLVVISGDLTQRATDREYADAQAFIQTLPSPRIAVPGNHDISATNPLARFATPWQKWRQFIHDKTEPLLWSPQYVAAGLNSARRLGLYLDWSRGRINRQQIDKLSALFSPAKPSQSRLLVVHHPFWLPKSHEKRELIGGRDAAIGQLAELNVDIIFSGHVHIAYTTVLEGVVISHAGTSTSNRLVAGQANSFNIISGDREYLEIETLRWCEQQFTPAARSCFQRKNGVWQIDSAPRDKEIKL